MTDTDKRAAAIAARQVTQTGEHFCETFCEERKRLLARAEKVESDRNQWRDQVIGAREIVDAAPDESLEVACATLVASAEKAAPQPAAEPAATDEARIAGSPAHVALWDAINAVVCASGGNAGCTSVARQRAVVEVESAVRAIMREFASRAERAEAEVEWLTGLLDDATSTAATQADDIDDLRARLAAAEQQLAAASKFPKGFVPGRVTRDDELPQWLSDMIEHNRKGRRDPVAIATIRLAVINLAERALAQEAGR